jgi:hypothetical protein
MTSIYTYLELTFTLITLIYLIFWCEGGVIEIGHKIKNPTWLLRFALPVYMIHELESAAIALSGSPNTSQMTLCNDLGFSSIHGCPATPEFFSTIIFATWIDCCGPFLRAGWGPIFESGYAKS